MNQKECEEKLMDVFEEIYQGIKKAKEPERKAEIVQTLITIYTTVFK